MLGLESAAGRFSVIAIANASVALSEKLSTRKRGRSRAPSKGRIEEVCGEVVQMRLADNYAGAGALHLVALWAWCHEQTYGVAPAMTAQDWKLAMFAADALVKREFEGKAEAAVPLLRWTWGEERRSTKWRRNNGRVINPLGWRLQFSARQVVRWRANGGGSASTGGP
jgi:hypothetical protein